MHVTDDVSVKRTCASCNIRAYPNSSGYLLYSLAVCEHLVRVVDDELLQAVGLERLKTKNVQYPTDQVHSLTESDGYVQLLHEVQEQKPVQLLHETLPECDRHGWFVILDDFFIS